MLFIRTAIIRAPWRAKNSALAVNFREIYTGENRRSQLFSLLMTSGSKLLFSLRAMPFMLREPLASTD